MTLRIDDGFATLITFSSTPGIKLWEKTVTPPGIQGGGENDTTTMRNSIWRTRHPKKLKTLSPMSFTAAYDPQVYDDLVSIVNVNQEITVTFPDGDEITFWGWLDEFTPGEIVEGAQPTADCTIIPSNQDNSNVETAPSVTP
jgi:hypothetical protein